MELLPSAFVRADNFQDVADIRLCPNQGFEHIRQNPMLDDRGALLGLAKIWIMRSKTLRKGRLNMSHEHPSDINWILLQIIEWPHGIEEGVVDLSALPDGNATVVNVALPDVLKNRVWLHRISRHQH